MKAKTLPVVGLILLLVLGIVLVVFLKFPDLASHPAKILSVFGVPPPECKSFPSGKFSGVVQKWEPNPAYVDIQTDDWCILHGFINSDPPGVVVVPINKPSLPKEEQIVLTRIGLNWEKAFCPGDKVNGEVVSNDAKLMNDIKRFDLKNIHNIGDRLCVFNTQ